MAKKYRIAANGQFLGHYYGTSPEKAVEKAVRDNFVYYQKIFGCPDCEFVAKRGLGDFTVFNWSDIPAVAAKFNIPTEA